MAVGGLASAESADSGQSRAEDERTPVREGVELLQPSFPTQERARTNVGRCATHCSPTAPDHEQMLGDGSCFSPANLSVLPEANCSVCGNT